MIDKATVDRIIDAADIVEVVSDYVSLKRRGANFVGLCPFHNERTPSFSVSKAKGLCHCFGCGKGGSPVNFIMEIEQISYYEALKHLAKKYNIEVHERELTDRERQEYSERESMLIVNEAACNAFENNLHNVDEGRTVGLSYFNERGFSAAVIKRFRLGYSLDKSTALYDGLTGKGFSHNVLIATGLAIDDRHGRGFDRFKGRAIFPIMNVAGKIVAFGGRTLKNEPAKYVNSPESAVYKKSNELYGLYQAKQAIVKAGKCFLVEGYADVISMHQSGFENTVASSGTSLTEGQIRLIHRFTENVTVLYDGDAAGIKASLRSIDLLLAEGLNIKVLLLPDGDDPDSFSQRHSTSEIQAYIDQNETDFIEFKMRISLEGAKNDPIKKSEVIRDVMKSIATIPVAITRSVYIKECSRRLEIDEQVLLNEIEKIIIKNRQKEAERRQKNRENLAIDSQSGDTPAPSAETDAPQQASDHTGTKVGPTIGLTNEAILYPTEEAVIRYIAKYGMVDFCDAVDAEGNTFRLTLVEYVSNELYIDDIHFSNPTFKAIFDDALKANDEFKEALSAFCAKVDEEAKDRFNRGIEEIKANAAGISEIEAQERALTDRIDLEKTGQINEFRANFLKKRLCSSPVDTIRTTASALAQEKHQLSKIHSRYAQIKTEQERLINVVPEAIFNWKSALIQCQIKETQKRLSLASDEDEVQKALTRMQDLYNLHSQLAKLIGERVVNPRK